MNAPLKGVRRRPATGLLLALLLLCGLLPLVSALPELEASFSGTQGDVELSATVDRYGDASVLLLPIYVRTQEAYGGYQFVINNATLSDPGSLPPSLLALSWNEGEVTTDPQQITARIDVALAQAGVYSQDITVKMRRSIVGALEETMVLQLQINVLAALDYRTDPIDSVTNVTNALAPDSMTEGTDYALLFKLRSLPSADVVITVTANAAHGDLPGLGPLGQPYRGRGPLVSLDRNSSVDVVQMTFTTADWNTLRRVPVYAVDNSLMQGDRWTSISFTFQSADAFYDALTLPALNVTISEDDFAELHIEANNGTLIVGPELISTTVAPGTTPDEFFTMRLGAQPLADVTLTLPSQGRYSLTPATLTWTPAEWSRVRQVRIHYYASNVLIGEKTTTQNFSTAVSTDADFAGLKLKALQVTYLDALNTLSSVSPSFSYYVQSAAAPVYVTMSYDSPATFVPSAMGENTLPEVACVFGNAASCTDPNNFYGARDPSCAAPYAQILVAGSVVSPTQFVCPVPGCPSILRSSASAGGVLTPVVSGAASDPVDECPDSYRVVALVNGYPSSNALPFRFLMPLEASDRKTPQVLSVSPSKIDVNAYVWITIRGNHFGVLDEYSGAKELASCRIADIVAPAVDVISVRETNAAGEEAPVFRCLSRPRPDLAGKTDTLQVLVEISFNGQEWISGVNSVVGLFDYDKKRTTTAQTVFFVIVALVGLLFGAMILQHLLCINLFRTHKEAAESTKIRVTRGPQMLIDLLEPQVLAQTLLVKDADKAEAALRREEAQEAVKKRIAEIQREALQKKEDKRRARAEKKAAREAAKQAEAARQAVLAAGGLTSEVEMQEIEERKEREERKRRKREKKEAAEAAIAALSSGAESGVESDVLSSPFASPDRAHLPLSPGPITPELMASPAAALAAAAPVRPRAHLHDSALEEEPAEEEYKGAPLESPSQPLALEASEPLTMEDLAMAAAAAYVARRGSMSEVEEPATSRKKKKEKKAKKEKKSSSAAEVEMGDMRAGAMPPSARAAAAAFAAESGVSELDTEGESGADTARSKKKKHKEKESKKKKKSSKDHRRGSSSAAQGGIELMASSAAVDEYAAASAPQFPVHEDDDGDAAGEESDGDALAGKKKKSKKEKKDKKSSKKKTK